MGKNYNKSVVNISNLLLVLGFTFVLPLVVGGITAVQGIYLFLFTSSTFALASKLSSRLRLNNEALRIYLPTIGTYIISILLFPLLLFPTAHIGIIVIALLVVLSVLLDFKQTVFEFNFQKEFVIGAGVSLVILLVFYRMPEALSATPLMYGSYFQDAYWFTANTASLTDGTFSTSLYEEGTGVYHHVLGLFPAAVISRICGMSTHTALWSIATPFGILCAVFSLMALLSQAVGKKPGVITLILGLCAILFTFPINPNYALAGRFTEMVWFGPGQTLPVLPTWVSIYVFSCLFVLLLTHVKEKLNFKMILLGMFLSLGIGWGKVTSYAMFFGAVMLFLVIYERKLFTKRQLLTIAGLLPVILLILTFYSNSSAKFVFEPGYIVTHFGNGTFNGISSLIKPLAIAAAALFIWFNIRLLIVAGLKDRLIKSLTVTAVLTLAVCLVLLATLRIKSFNGDGVFMIDTSFDLLQFTRSSFIYIAMSFGVFYVMLSTGNLVMKTWLKKTVHFALIIWISIVILTSIPSQIAMHEAVIQRPWDTEVIDELKKHPDSKKAMVSSVEYSGQFITAHDIGPFYTCLKDREGGYTYAFDYLDRYDRLQSFIDKNEPSNYLEELKENKVTILVANPQNISNFLALTNDKVLKRVDNTKWLFTYD